MARRSEFAPVPHHEYPELRLEIWELSFLYLSRAGPGPGTFPEPKVPYCLVLGPSQPRVPGPPRQQSRAKPNLGRLSLCLRPGCWESRSLEIAKQAASCLCPDQNALA